MMNLEEFISFCQKLGCSVQTECCLNSYTTFRIGGKCSALVEVNSAVSASELIKYIRKNNIKYAVLGKGSNVLVPDEGFDGVVLHIGNDFSDISVNGSIIKADAGASLASVCKKAQQLGLSGMENLYGIPGTAGGGLYMNAGAYGTEMKDVVLSAEYIDENGNICTMMAADMELSYRMSVFCNKKFIITSVTFGLSEGDPEAVKAAMTECMEKRKAKQPLEFPSAGSTFKRPEGSYASLLIDECGLKGLSVGGAMVSEKHCGFVINTGNATCTDVIGLCSKIKDIVKEKTGYTLEMEPIILK